MLQSIRKDSEKLKHEIDIYITDGKSRFAIELKYTSIKKNKDGFKTYSVVIVNSIVDEFYTWKKRDKDKSSIIYKYFRCFENGQKTKCLKSIEENEVISYSVNINNNNCVKAKIFN